ncbi:MAG: response regulator [Chloroflexota bacterium]
MSRPAQPRAHILVVDDEPAIVESLYDLLQAQGQDYFIATAADGREAITYLHDTLASPEDGVDLVLLDMRMPATTGADVVAWIRRQPALQSLRVMMLTAASGTREKVQALSAGADDYVTKPYYPQELLARVNNMLRARQLEKELQRQSQQLAALNRISHTVTASLETAEVLAAAVNGLPAIIAVQAAAIFMAGQGTAGLVCQQVYSQDGRLTAADFAPASTKRGVIGRVFSKKTSLCLNDPPQSAYFQAEVDAPAAFDTQSILAVPLVVRRRAVGVLCAYNKQDGPFTEVDVDLCASLAGSLSRAVENAWLFQSVKLRQMELLESRNTLNAVIDGILHAIYTISDDWRLVAVNKTKADQLGRPAETLLGQTCFQTFFERDAPCEHCAVGRTIADQQPQRWTVQCPGPDNMPQEWEVNAYPVPGTQAGSARAVVVWQDVTEARRLEQSLLQAGKLAAIGQLAAGVAHEINNPLTVINASAQMLKMGISEEDDRYELVDLVALAGERAARVVRGLLDFARQEQYEFQAANVNDSLNQAMDLLAHQMQTAGITLRRHLTADLPLVTASWDHLTSVWINLLINARDALLSQSGERRVEVETRLATSGDEVQVLVHDNGPGIAAVHLPRIFEPFYTTKAPGQGTGLGLATSHRIIAQHGGMIEAVNRPDGGTTFIIRLPVAGLRPATGATNEA